MKRDRGQTSHFVARHVAFGCVADKGTGGEVANALVCKTSIHGFKSHPVLQYFKKIEPTQDGSNPFSTQ
jgi:hypothetical protein